MLPSNSEYGIGFIYRSVSLKPTQFDLQPPINIYIEDGYQILDTFLRFGTILTIAFFVLDRQFLFHGIEPSDRFPPGYCKQYREGSGQLLCDEPSPMLVNCLLILPILMNNLCCRPRARETQPRRNGCLESHAMSSRHSNGCH